MFHSLKLVFVLDLILTLTNIDTAGVIHGKYTDNIKNYHLAVPHKATPEGEFHSFHLPHFHEYDSKQFMKRKRKREATDPDAVHYGIPVDNELHHVELWPDRDFLHPQAVIERRDPNLPVKDRDVRLMKNNKMCYYHGNIRGVDKSRAALSTCDGLTGYIRIRNKTYFIEPVQEHTPNEKGHHLHVIHAPDIGGSQEFCGMKNSVNKWEENIKTRLIEEIQNGKNIFKREDTKSFDVVPKWMEMLTVCDKKMIMKHKGRRDLYQWIMTLFSIMKSLFSEESMTGVLMPVLVRVVLLEKEEEEIDLEIGQNCYKTIANFCNWTNKELQPKSEDHPNHFDMAILLSDWDFCVDEVDCGTQGLATIGGACSTTANNCEISEDKGLLSSFIFTHEAGHLIGMEHDGQPPVPCNPVDESDKSWYVMAPSAYMHTIRWSPCSTASMRSLAEAGLLECLNNEPTHTDYPIEDVLPGVVYDRDEQCRMMFRDTSVTNKSCLRKNRIDCKVIRCQFDDGCLAYDQYLAPGTPCGENKWCFDGECLEKGTISKVAKDGGWGEWGDWSPCTKTCGRGVQIKERLCDNPKPKNHGRYCLGTSKEYRICNPQECPLDAPSFRDQECKRLAPTSSVIKQGYATMEDYSGPYFSKLKPCEAWCTFKDGTKRLSVANSIGDGAKCEIGNPMKICVASACVEVGCDNKFDSSAILDRCGICNGDGTMCKVVEGSDSATAGKGCRLLCTVPAGSRNFRIEETEPNTNLLALGKPDGVTITFNADFKAWFSGVFPQTSRGKAYFLYDRVRTKVPGTEDIETINWDHNVEDIGVYVCNRRSSSTPTLVKWSWIEPTDSPIHEPKYRWEIADYKECSARCEGGFQEAIMYCFEEIGGKVSETFCKNLEKPPEDTKKCNDHPCEPEWKVGNWGRCRACKEKGGVRIRAVECVKPNPRPIGDDIIVEDSECKGPKPGTAQLCETMKKCGSRNRKAIYVPAKFQNTVWRQMNKLHLVKREVLKKPRVFLKGKAPTCTPKTTPFTWKPGPPSDRIGKLAIDTLHASDQPAPVIEVDKVINVEEIKGEHNLAGPESEGNTFLIPGTTAIFKHIFPKRYQNITRKKKNSTTTHKPKPKPHSL